MVDLHPAGSSTVHRHRRQTAWQILVPFFVMLVLIIAAAVVVVVGGAPQIRLWSDVSIIWLIIPVLLFILTGIAILAGLIYAIARLTRAIPPFTSRAQMMTERMFIVAHRLADGTTKPILWFQEAGAMFRAIAKKT